jgi:hypothetical protein
MKKGNIYLQTIMQIKNKPLIYNTLRIFYLQKKRKDDFSNAWDTSLNHQLKVIADFKIFFNKVIKIISEIK